MKLLVVSLVALVALTSFAGKPLSKAKVRVSTPLTLKIVDAEVMDALEGEAKKQRPEATVTSVEVVQFTYEATLPVRTLEEDELVKVNINLVLDVDGEDDLFCEGSLEQHSSGWKTKIHGCEI